MISVEVDWDGVRQQVLLKSPTRKHRNQYLGWMKKIDGSKLEEEKYDILEEFLAWRDDLIIELLIKGPDNLVKDKLDEVPLVVLNIISKKIEENLSLTQDFQQPSNGPQTPTTASTMQK